MSDTDAEHSVTGREPTKILLSEDRLAPLLSRALEDVAADREPDLESICGGDTRAMRAVADALGLAGAFGRVSDVHRTANAVASDPLLRADAPLLAGRYRITARLGAGAMGVVYRAEDTELGRSVAVKLLGGLAAEAQQDTATRRFLREAEACASIQHRNVVTVHDRGEAADGRPFLVMECLEGLSLAALLAEAVQLGHDDERLRAFRDHSWVREHFRASITLSDSTLRTLVSWIATAADGLAAAHDRGVVHRDVKPSNLYLADEPDGPRVVVLDFGIAAVAAQRDGDLTATGVALGTPWYMAPETVGPGAGEPAAAVDVYGLAATLYHALALEPPYTAPAIEALATIRTADPLPLQKLHPHLPRDLVAVVECGMARDPRQRYRTMRAFADDLRAFLDHRPTAARPAGPIGRARRWIRRRPVTVSAIGLGLAAATAFAISIPLAVARGKRDRAEYERLAASVPALLTIEGDPAQRMLIGSEERTAQLTLLDRLVELEPREGVHILIRAAVHLDSGNRDAASADMQRVARLEGTPYLTELARRYRLLPVGARGVADLDTSGLPEPTSHTGALADALHALRLRTRAGYTRATKRLDPIARDSLPARDLRLICLLATGRFDEAEQEARVLESLYQQPTARTRHVIGMTLAARGRYDEAIPVLHEAIERRPGRHGPLHNLGVCYQRTGDLDRAREFLLQAHHVRPWLDNTLRHLVEVEAACWNFEEALEWAEKIPNPAQGSSRWKRPYMETTVAWHRMMRALHTRTTDEVSWNRVREEANRYIESADAAAGTQPPRRIRNDIKSKRDLARYLASASSMDSGDPNEQALLADMFASAATPPLDAEAVATLAAFLPDSGLSPKFIPHLRHFLVRVAAGLSPGRPVLQRLSNELEREVPPNQRSGR